VRDITNLKRGEIKIDLVFNRIQPSGGRPRQPSGSDLSFPYGECLNKRKAKQPKCIESPRATGARSGTEKVSLATNVKRLCGDHAQTKRQSAMPINQTASRSRPDFYFELAGMMTDRILA
jgi:hypothetical protein